MDSFCLNWTFTFPPLSFLLTSRWPLFGFENKNKQSPFFPTPAQWEEYAGHPLVTHKGAEGALGGTQWGWRLRPSFP